MMKFSCSVDINLPRHRVIQLFDNPENMKYWQDGFISFNPVSGNPGEVGAQSHITYKMGRKEMVLLETVALKDLPHTFHGIYEGDFGKNTMNSYFEEIGPNKTRWRSDLEYLEARGFVMKIMTKIMPSVMKKQTQKWMDQFKRWSEEQSI